MVDMQPVFFSPYGDARDSTAQHGYKYDVQDGLVVDLGRFFCIYRTAGYFQPS
jgi:hypothetical protein